MVPLLSNVHAASVHMGASPLLVNLEIHLDCVFFPSHPFFFFSPFLFLLLSQPCRLHIPLAVSQLLRHVYHTVHTFPGAQPKLSQGITLRFLGAKKHSVLQKKLTLEEQFQYLAMT